MTSPTTATVVPTAARASVRARPARARGGAAYVRHLTARPLNTHAHIPPPATAVSEVSETHCYSLESPEDLATFPSLALLLDGAEWVVPPEGLFQSMTWFTNPSQ